MGDLRIRCGPVPEILSMATLAHLCWMICWGVGGPRFQRVGQMDQPAEGTGGDSEGAADTVPGCRHPPIRSQNDADQHSSACR